MPETRCNRSFAALSLRTTALSLLLGAIGLVLLLVGQRLLDGPEPKLDFSRTVATAGGPGEGELDGRLRFAVAAMVSAEATFSTYRDLVQHISQSMQRSELFVMRPTYEAVREGLENGDIDVALVCTGTYVNSLDSVRLLVQPEFEDHLSYHSVIIVAADSPALRIEDLRGQSIAFTEQESNTGYIAPCVLLADMGLEVRSHFGRKVFTGSHDRSILAVTGNVVSAAAVMALVLDSSIRNDPPLAEHVRVIWRSEPFGPPPVVVPIGIDAELENQLRQAFLSLHESPEGRRLLANLGIRRFLPPQPEQYATAIDILGRFQALKEGP